MAAEPGHRLRGLVEIGVDQIAPVLNVERGASSVEPTRSQNMTVIGRRSAELRCAKDCAGVGAGASGPPLVVSGCCAPSSAIALSIRFRSPRGMPSSWRSPSVRSASTSRPILFVSKLFLVLAEAETAEPHADVHDRALTWVKRP